MTGGSLDRGMSTRNGSKLGSMQPLADVVMRPPEPDNGEVHNGSGDGMQYGTVMPYSN